MGINQDAVAMIRTQLCSRIDQIAEGMAHIPAAKLAGEIDDIRRIASNYGLVVVADIAHGLESALSRSDGAITILPFLESMRDAVGCDRLEPLASETFLTMVNLRLHG